MSFAFVSQYGEGEADLLVQSHGTLSVVRYQGKQALRVINILSIKSLIGMVPIVLSADEAQDNSLRAKYSQCFFVAEKPFNDIANDSLITYETNSNGCEDETIEDDESEDETMEDDDSEDTDKGDDDSEGTENEDDNGSKESEDGIDGAE